MSEVNIVHRVRGWLRGAGIDVSPFPRLGTIQHHIRQSTADLLIDVGANAGQFGSMARQWGFAGRIVSFEPVKHVHDQLAKLAQRDGNWSTYNLALGETDGEGVIHVSADPTLSSLLTASELMDHVHPGPGSTQSEQKITIRRLDHLREELKTEGRSIWLKTDTQGFDFNVVRGAEELLPQVQMIQMELSTRPLYQGLPPMDVVLAYLRERGFFVADIILGGRDKDGLIELDAIFKRLQPQPAAANQA